MSWEQTKSSGQKNIEIGVIDIDSFIFGEKINSDWTNHRHNQPVLVGFNLRGDVLNSNNERKSDGKGRTSIKPPGTKRW